jgi:Ca2+-binding EF-hand superfamily protein
MPLWAGFINEERLRELLTTMGDRFTEEEVNYSITSMFLAIPKVYC